MHVAVVADHAARHHCPVTSGCNVLHTALTQDASLFALSLNQWRRDTFLVY
jgi:hypothetical protein